MLRTELQQVEQIPIDRLVLHRLEPRKVREPEHIQEILESIKENGFDQSRALKVVPENGHFAIFAGGTRYSAILELNNITAQCCILSKGKCEKSASVNNKLRL